MNKAIQTIVNNTLVNQTKKRLLSFFFDKELLKLKHDIIIPKKYIKNISSENNIKIINELETHDYCEYILNLYGLSKEESKIISLAFHANIIMYFIGELNNDMSDRQIKFLNKTCGNFNIVQKEVEKKFFNKPESVFSIENDGSLSQIIEKIIVQNKVYDII